MKVILTLETNENTKKDVYEALATLCNDNGNSFTETCTIKGFVCPFGNKCCSSITKNDWKKAIKFEEENITNIIQEEIDDKINLLEEQINEFKSINEKLLDKYKNGRMKAFKELNTVMNSIKL